MGAMLALAGCAQNGGPRPSSHNYIESPVAVPAPLPAPPPVLAPGPSPRVVVPRHRPAANCCGPKQCPRGMHWVRAHRAPGAGGPARHVPGRCAH